jgi:xylulokinase
MAYIGIDIGSSGAKAIGVSEEGAIIASAYREYTIHSPYEGWFELNPREVISVCKETISNVKKQISAGGKDQARIKAIGISSQGEAFTVLDGSGNYLCNAMISSDARSKEQVKRFAEEFGAERLYRITGHTPATLYSLFKVLWLKENRPEIFHKIKRLLCMGDLLSYELTGEAVISHNLAARTMMFDVSRRRWSGEVLDAIGLDEGVLSLTTGAGALIGKIRPEIVYELGLEKNTLVITGGHDQSCGALGVGATGPKTAAYSIGTVECVTPAFSECILNETMMNANLATYPHTAEGLYTTVAFCITGGCGLRWFRDEFGQYEAEKARQDGKNVYDLLTANMPEEPSGLLVLPHFTATGTPYFDPSPTGAILGVKLTTRKGELVKGLLEGISYETKLNIELLRNAGIELNELRAFGGGTNSAKWMQIKADVFGMPITTVSVSEAGCIGAAMLAAKGCGDITSIGECSRQWIKQGRIYDPDAKKAAVYRERFEKYRGLYWKMKEIFKNER